MKATRVDGKDKVFQDGKTDDAGTIANVTTNGVMLNSFGKFEATQDVCGIGTKWDATQKKCIVKLSDVCGQGTKKNSDSHKCVVDETLLPRLQQTATMSPQGDQSLNNRDISALMLSAAALRNTTPTVPESNEISTENLFCL